jgi:hypothetical protein
MNQPSIPSLSLWEICEWYLIVDPSENVTGMMEAKISDESLIEPEVDAFALVLLFWNR